MTPSSRLSLRFTEIKQRQRGGLISFIMAGDPDHDTCRELLRGLPAAGADIIELGMPFTDPMADGPAIQAAGLRALKHGASMKRTLDLVRDFRQTDTTTPIILMGYYNPIYSYSVDKFLDDAKEAGIDGLIVVDLPPEEDAELCLPATAKGVAFIRLITPTTDAARLTTILTHASGFLYYVSVTGITGDKKADYATVSTALAAIRAHTGLPIAAGFGISTPEQVAAITQSADAAVVGSAIVNRIAVNLDGNGKAKAGLVDDVLGFVRNLAG